MLSRATVCLLLLFAVGCRKDAEPSPPATPTSRAASPVAKVATVRFEVRPPVVGSRYEDSSSSNLRFDMKLTVPGKPLIKSAIALIETGRFEVEFVAVDGEAPTRAKVRYLEKRSTELDDGRPKPTPESPVLGKSYLLALSGTGMDITTAAGAPVSLAERNVLLADCDFIGRPDDFRAALKDRVVHVGEGVPELRRALEKVVAGGASKSEGPQPVISDVSVALKEDRGAVGTFDIGLTMALADGPVKMTMRLTGELDIRKADAQLVRLVIEGPVTVTPAQGTDVDGVGVDGSGTMSIVMQQKQL